MKLYYAPGACSLADHIALIESGLPFETDQVDLKTRTTAEGADYALVNPKGYVPALALDEGGVLTENIAILSYIAEKSGRLALDGPLGKFRLLEALAYISTELHKGFKPFFAPDADDADRAHAREALLKRMALFEDKLSNQPFALGEGFTVADCYLFVMLFWARHKAEIELPQRLSAYFDALSGREGVRRALSDEGIG